MSAEKHSASLERTAIIKAFQEISDELAHRGTTGELCLFGGAVMVLAFVARPSTKDVDAILQPSQPLRDVARSVGEANGLPANWLNDAAKAFTSVHHKVVSGNLP